MSDEIELMMLCRVLQSNFSCLSLYESRTQPCHVRIGVLYAAFRRKFTSGAHNLRVQRTVLTVLNNSLPVCLCVYVNKHKSQRERNKRNEELSYTAP